jgi:IclR helix-turn-helix domain
VSECREVTITLTDVQVARVMREASGGPVLGARLAGLNDLDSLQSSLLGLLDELRYSRSTLRALLVLSAFPVDGGARELSDVARQLDFSPSTTHRYMRTWRVLGLLEQDADSRRYRRVST